MIKGKGQSKKSYILTCILGRCGMDFKISAQFGISFFQFVFFLNPVFGSISVM